MRTIFRYGPDNLNVSTGAWEVVEAQASETTVAVLAGMLPEVIFFFVELNTHIKE